MSERRQLRGELARFALVGGIAVAIDGATYYTLVRFGSLDPVASKRISFATGAAWAFFANKFFTFQTRGFALQQPVFFTLVYLVGWLLNSVVHDLVLRACHQPVVAFLAATSISTMTNFAGQKWLVFRAGRSASS
jgi:putative flippase GtrA